VKDKKRGRKGRSIKNKNGADLEIPCPGLIRPGKSKHRQRQKKPLRQPRKTKEQQGTLEEYPSQLPSHRRFVPQGEKDRF
jgi:hypothetical protein